MNAEGNGRGPRVTSSQRFCKSLAPFIFFVVFSMILAVTSAQGAGTTATFRVGPTNRYLIDPNNQPVFLVGDSPHTMFAALSVADATTFLANRASYGVNTLWVELICTSYLPNCRSNMSTFDGILPFTPAGDISTPNPAYFSRVDAMVNAAAQNGITILMDTWETGAGMPLLRSNGNTKAFNYGVYLGNRYKDFPNIIWIAGNDFQTWRDSTDNNLIKNIMAGIASVDSNHLQTTQLDYHVSGSHDDALLLPYTSLAAVYSYPPQYVEIYKEYNASPTLPVFMEEANYEGENNTGSDPSTPLLLRKQEYWSMLAGALAGQIYGTGSTGYFSSGWQNGLNTTGIRQLQYMKNFFAAKQWYNLVPDQNHTVVTAGYGTFTDSGTVTDNDYLTAARTSDGTLVIAYLPTRRTITVDMTKLSGQVTAQWFDPANNTTSTVSGSPFANTGSRQFTPTGNNSDDDGDWVLLLTVGSGTLDTPLGIPTDGGEAWVTADMPPAVTSGYARVQRYTGDSPLSGLAIFGFRQGQVLVTEAGVPATTPVYAGRVYVDVNGPVNTGIAFANPSDRSALISFYFTDMNGTDFGQGSFTLNAAFQTAAFLNQAPFGGRNSMQGTFTFSSTVPISAIALRSFTNERGEFLMTTLPVSSLSTETSNTALLPQFADGGGVTTQVILTNTSDLPMTGRVQFYGPGDSNQGASVLNMSINGVADTAFSYTIPPHAAVRLVTGNSSPTIQVGSVRITPTAGTTPEAIGIFSFRANGVTVSEAGVSATPTGTAFRMYTEVSAGTDVGLIESGVALANPSPNPVMLKLELTRMDGSSPVLPAILVVPANGQISKFISQLFPNLPRPFQGSLKVTAGSPIGLIGIRSRYNERGDFLMTTTPAQNEDLPLRNDELVFPQVVSGGGYNTVIIVYGSASTGSLRLVSQGGTTLPATNLQALP